MSQSMTSKPYEPYTQPPLFCPVIQNGRCRLPRQAGAGWELRCLRSLIFATFWSEENQRERLDYRSNPGEAEIDSPCDWFSRHLTMERVPAARENPCLQYLSFIRLPVNLRGGR